MTLLIRFFAIFSTCLWIAACSPTADTSEQNSIVGTKAAIKAHGNVLILEIKDYTDNVVISEVTNWHGELVSRRHYYRGLYPIAGSEGSSQWEMDFDVTKIDALFPLKVGNSTSFSGNMKDIENNKAYDFWAHIEVVAKKPFMLPSGKQKTYVLRISTEYDWNGRPKRTLETIYYSPELNMNLKGVTHEGNSQKYWRVTSIEKPDSPPTLKPARQQRRRSGTVLI